MHKISHRVSARMSRWVVSIALMGCLSGCNHASSSPRPLAPQSFYPGERRIQEDPRSEINHTENPSGITFPKPVAPEPPPLPRVEPATGPSTLPATRPSLSPRSDGGIGFGDTAIPAAAVGLSSGQFQLIGSVVAKVNDTPIYANKVLTLINKPLMQKARELTQAEFKTFARGLIQNQVGELVNDEVLFAAAQRALSDEDRRIVDAMTEQWRGQQITQAGGSIQLARARAAADSDDFDELVRHKYRENMIEMFRVRKLMPRVQVTVNDLRRYYDKHKDEEFTEHEAARFRLLEVSVEKTGTREDAFNKVRAKHERAVKNGEDFTAMCAKENDDPGLAARSGDMGWRNRGSLPREFEKVETEVWKLQPGQITEVIDIGKAFYIAKLEQVRAGRVRQFNEQPSGVEPSVQEIIRGKLQKDQLRELSFEFDAKLRADAIVDTNNEMLDLCVLMAMQRYDSLTKAQ